MAFERPQSPQSIKAAQLADLIRDLLAKYIQREISGSIITVTSVTLSHDFHYATAWIRVFPSTQSDAVFARLTRMRSLFQRQLRSDIPRKIIPDLEISLDTNPEDESHITELLK